MRRFWPLLVSVLLSGCVFGVYGKGIQVSEVHSWNQEGKGYFADIDVAYDLPKIVIDALDNGVPLVFVMKLRIEQDGEFWFNRKEETVVIFRVRYRPLSTLYEVDISSHDQVSKQQFVSRAALLEHLGELREIPVAAAGELQDDHDYLIAMKIQLDIQSLPLPIRPKAYLSPAWNQTSGWSRWPLNR